MDTRKIVSGAFIGAGVMYLFDRQAGKRRRAMIRDKAVHGAHVIQEGMGKVSRDTRNRLKGFSAELKHVFPGEEASGSGGGERVRSNLGGRVTSPLMRENWPPAVRFFTGLAGSALIAFGMGKRRLPGLAIAALPILVRAFTNMPLRRIVGVSGRRGVDIEKTIQIDAPVEKVFKTLSRVEEFPNFMTHVQRVAKLGRGRYRWTVAGPAGLAVSWDSVLTSIDSNRHLAWRSEPGSIVKHAGIVKFQPNPDGSTAVNIRLTYNPVIGSLGHAILSVLGADPKTLLDDDLHRAKTFLETEKQPHDAVTA